jgi:hypothetical protein
MITNPCRGLRQFRHPSHPNDAAEQNDAADSHEPRTLVLLRSSPRLMPAADLASFGNAMRPAMNIKVTDVDYAPDDLRGQTPFTARILRQIPGSDRPDYFGALSLLQ